jgi:hypothetical protein
MKTIIDLAIACAVTTWDQRTIDEDGTVVVATLPQQGDWDALEEMLGRRWTDDEDRAFSNDFCDAIARLAGNSTIA